MRTLLTFTINRQTERIHSLLTTMAPAVFTPARVVVIWYS